VAELALISVNVQEADFDVAQLQSSLLMGAQEEGAVATFTGYVRAANDERQVYTLELEHYPGMTETSIRDIVNRAAQRWPLLAAAVVHRVGKLSAGDQIVWVGVASAHREAAFSACEFIMDYLKTRAPFWKKELGPEGEHWVSARQHDNSRAARWQDDNGL
jgi:molybdopterin synthase catalytic subunit